MEALSSRPVNVVRVEFEELNARHLCRHSQFGINVAHLVALFGVWYAVYSIMYWLGRTAGMPDATPITKLYSSGP